MSRNHTALTTTRPIGGVVETTAHINTCALTALEEHIPCTGAVGGEVGDIRVLPQVGTTPTPVPTPVTAQVVKEANKRNLPTPINVSELSAYLNGYHKQHLIVEGFSKGFVLGYQGSKFAQAKHNARLAEENPQILHQLLEKEVELGRFRGPFNEMPFHDMHISPLSIREKSTPGEFCLLHNLSYPYDDRSVNLGIPDELKTVKYETVGDAIKHILKLGRNCYMGKINIVSVPHHPSQAVSISSAWSSVPWPILL